MSHSSRPAVVPDHSLFDRLVHHSDAGLGATVLLPFDSEWLVQSGSLRPIALLVGLAALAILALLIASTARQIGQRQRARHDGDDELFTAPPLPMPSEHLARLKRESTPPYAFSTLKLPRWLQVGSLVVALGMTWMVYERIRPGNGQAASATAQGSDFSAGAADRARDDMADSPEDLNPSPDSAPRFSFRAQDWVALKGGCAGRLEVTRGEPNSWSLTARVHDDQGQLIDSARKRVASLRKGDVVEFRFARATCERIGAWDVRGARRVQ